MDPQQQDPAPPIFIPEDLGSATKVALNKEPQEKKRRESAQGREEPEEGPRRY